MDFAKLIDFLHQYPVWYRYLVVIWMIASAVLAGGLIVLKSDPSVSQSPRPNVAPSITQAPVSPAAMPLASSPPAPASPVDVQTAEAYFTALRSLSERFLEKQEFVEKMSGSTVEWQGLVATVSQRKSHISLTITVEGIKSEPTVYASLPDSLRMKAFSLQKGDLVRVKGKLSLSTPNMPDVNVTDLTVVRPRGAS